MVVFGGHLTEADEGSESNGSHGGGAVEVGVEQRELNGGDESVFSILYEF